MANPENKIRSPHSDLSNNLREEYKSLCGFIRLFFTLRLAAISICISIFGIVFVFSKSISPQIQTKLLPIVLLLTVFAGSRLTLATSRAMYRIQIYVRESLEPKLGISYFSVWHNYVMKKPKDNMTRALVPIYFTFNIIGLLYSVINIKIEIEKIFDSNLSSLYKLTLDNIITLIISIAVAFMFVWNSKILFWDLKPKGIIEELSKEWKEITTNNVKE